jgi:hypothetical protein
MTISDEFLKCVPVGEEHAVSSRHLWQHIGMWAATSVKGQLHKMAAQGLIQSRANVRERTRFGCFFERQNEQADRSPLQVVSCPTRQVAV